MVVQQDRHDRKERWRIFGRLRKRETNVLEERNKVEFHRDNAQSSLDMAYRDWAFYADDPHGALGGNVKQWCFWWSEETQLLFDEAWGPDADAQADELADSYAFVWPWMIPNFIQSRAPDTQARIEHILKNRELVARTNQTNPLTVLYVSTLWGAFHAVRKRRSWKTPQWRNCSSCGEKFFGGEPPIWTHRQFGPARYCEKCCLQVRRGNTAVRSSETAIGAVRELASALEMIPAQNYAFQTLPVSLPYKRCDRIVRALCAMPPPTISKSLLGVSDWFGVLQAAELVDKGWRPSRGTWCRAIDGHLCRSLLEKSIDDWFSNNGVVHVNEPYWPKHPTLNPSGRKRADWRLQSGAYVECAGMMKSEMYYWKMHEKVTLAHALEIRLYVVEPSDLLNLETLFSAELQSGPSERATKARSSLLTKKPSTRRTTWS